MPGPRNQRDEDNPRAREVGASPQSLVLEGHQRITQSLMSIVAPLIGFSVLMLGGFSRFGVWNQIIAAIVLIVILQTFDNAMADVTLSNGALWPLVYLPATIGFLASMLMLWLAANPGLWRRRRATA